MLKAKILLVEHDEKFIRNVAEAFDKEDVSIYYARTLEEIEQHVSDIALDLIITDVFWPDKDPKAKHISKLREIIDKIRLSKNPNSVVPIVALSARKKAQEEALKDENAEEIYDLWSKNAGYPEFFNYRVKNLIERRQGKLGEDALLKAILNVFDKNPHAWKKDSIQGFINDYFRISSIGEMLSKIREFYGELCSQIGIDSNYADGTFKAFAEAEPLDLARRTDAWGHLRHSLSVFFSGYVLLNSTDSPFFQDQITVDLGLANWEEVNQAWFLACSFHDTDVFLGHVPEIFKRFVDIPSKRIKMVNNYNLKNLSDCEIIYLPEDSAIVAKILNCMKRDDLLDLVAAHMDKAKVTKKADHAIIAAIELYFNAINNQKYTGKLNILVNACYAILLHHCRDDKLILDKKSDFLAQLLCFIDSFQAWGRENLYENLFDGEIFEKVVLRQFDLTNISSDKNEKMLTMKVDYLTFRYISPSDSNIPPKEKKLRRAIRKNYDELIGMKILKNPGEDNFYGLKLDFSFCILGRKVSVLRDNYLNKYF